MKRKFAYAFALLAWISWPALSTAALVQSGNEQYNACIQGCIDAAQIYGWEESPYWAGYSACQRACNEYNPEQPPSNDPPPGRQCVNPGISPCPPQD